jgi:aerobic-type carbon monoxide dehydrogenase small subunit (CoxS/CutS family)
VRLELTVNGRPIEREVASQTLLLDFVRDDLGLTGAKRSCEMQVCGTCTLLVDGQPVSACCYLAADAVGRDVLTIEGLRERPEFERLERAFLDHAALQCGFCTPGMLLTVSALLAEGALGSEEAIKRNLAGNLCRCTGYRGIVDAVADLAGVRA